MKKNTTIILSVVAITCCFVSCNKLKDKWYPEYQNPHKEFDLCRITEIHQSAGPLVRDRTGIFYYSSNGNLDSVVFDDRGIVHYWKYDEHNVLMEYRDAFEHDITDFITLHKYASANGRVVRDTTWLEGASGYIIQVWSLEYDSKGRIIRETGFRIDSEAPGVVLPDKVYTYNEQGNLVGGTYDREVNFLRTNKVLQFIHRNYSTNNESQFILGYNQYHLPVGFRMPDYGSFLKGGTPTKLSYSCVPIPPVIHQKDQCRLSYVSQMSGNNTIVDGTFYYTPDGLPLSVQYIQRNFNSESNTHRFEYGKHKELIRYQIFDGIYAFTRHSYGYSGNKITLDTLYSDLGEEFIQVSRLQYDSESRIIKEDIQVIERNFAPVSEFSTREYVYDNRGNLVSPLVTSYDNKVNYLRTDPLWMFIHRNYSRNNPQGVTQYNNKDLPLGFTGKVFGFLDFGEPSVIEYACSENIPPGKK